MGMDYSLVPRIIDGLGKILDTKPGSPDEGTYVTEQQLANWIKEQTVVPAYYYNGVMYSDALHTTPITGQAGALYIDQDNNVLYRWDATLGDYVQLSVDLSDYATLDDLAAEESARETADTNLNNAFEALGLSIVGGKVAQTITY